MRKENKRALSPLLAILTLVEFSYDLYLISY